MTPDKVTGLAPDDYSTRAWLSNPKCVVDCFYLTFFYSLFVFLIYVERKSRYR